MKQNQQTIILLFFLLLLGSCKEVDELSGDDVPGYSPILVSAKQVASFTRAYIPQGMYDNFKVYAVAEKGNAQMDVMKGYDVWYVNNDWTYVTDSQPLMYWSSDADRYLFAAGAPVSAVTAMSATSMTLFLKNNQEGSAMASQPQKIEKTSPDYGKTVNLHFGYAHCMVSVAFLNQEAAEVTGITLTPSAPIASEAKMTYTYDWSTTPATASTQLMSTAWSNASFSFASVTIPAGATKAVASGTHYYCVPDAANTTGWTVSLTCNGEQKTASFVNSHTWQSGKHYIYVFSITEKGVKLVKVISSSNYFYCKDIELGGIFSDEDMTFTE